MTAVARPAVSWTTAAPEAVEGTGLVLRQALVPMQIWHSVPVACTRSRQLSHVEQFLLAAAVELHVVTEEDFEELLGLPKWSLTVLAAGLVRAGALTQSGTACLPTPRSADVLADKVLPRWETVPQTFLHLPRTGDLLGLPGAGGGRSGTLAGWWAEKAPTPDVFAPVPESLWDLSRGDVINARLRDGPVPGAPSGAQQVENGAAQESAVVLATRSDSADDDPPVTLRGCPAYRWEHIRFAEGRSEGAHLSFELSQRPGRPERDGKGRHWRIPQPPGLYAYWSGLADQAGRADVFAPAAETLWGRRLADEVGAPVRTTAGSAWLELSRPAARYLARSGRRLTQPLGLRIDAQDAEIDLRVELAPADPAAGLLFAVDRAVDLLLGPEPRTLDDAGRTAFDEQRMPWPLAADPGSDGSGDDLIRRRLWELEYYTAIYQLREKDDFGYDQH